MTTAIMERNIGPVSFASVHVVSGGVYQDAIAAGLVYENAGAPTNGTTLANVAAPGKLLVDTTNHTLYQNTGTKGSPTWAALTQVGGLAPATSVTRAIVASATHTLNGATALTSQVNILGTVTGAGDAVRLPALAVGQHVDVYNDGASAAAVFPAASNVAIDGGSAGASVVLTNAKRCRYTCTSATTIESAQLGVVSA